MNIFSRSVPLFMEIEMKPYLKSMVLILLVSSLSLAAEREGKGPHGGTIHDLKQGSFEVVVDRKQRKVDLYALNQLANPLPPEIFLQLLAPSARIELKLRTADPWQGLPHFQGTLPHFPAIHPALSSAKGFEVVLSF